MKVNENESTQVVDGLRDASDACIQVAENFFNDSDGPKADLMRAATACERGINSHVALAEALRAMVTAADRNNVPLNTYFAPFIEQARAVLAQVEGKEARAL